MSNEKETVSCQQTKCDWQSIDWKAAISYVADLRRAIFQATKVEDYKKVRTLTRIMLRSYENRVLSVRRVTQTNRGKGTAGVDKIIVKTAKARGELVDVLGQYDVIKADPTKRVYIPKANGKKRPLGIPTVFDRCVQAIVKNALEPIWEAQFEDSSHGFRPGRCPKDAMERIFSLLCGRGSRKWVFDADIKGAFDNISHEKLMELIGNFPARDQIQCWLKAGYLEDGAYYDTESGTPQGGVISPLLANIALHGMEEVLGIKFNPWDNSLHKESVGLVRYADDFVVICHTKEQAEEAKQTLIGWLAQRGLQLSEEKTRIVHITDGFDFLGFNVRQFERTDRKSGVKLIIRPSAKSVKAIRKKLKETFRRCRGSNVAKLVKEVNPIIRGWADYYKGSVSKRTFTKLDDYLFTLQVRWTKWQHSKKSYKWRLQKYWGQWRGKDRYVFGEEDRYMLKFQWTPIRRHIGVRRFAAFDDPDLQEYWTKRKEQLTRNNLRTKVQKQIARTQQYVCPVCGDTLANGEVIEEHHHQPRSEGGNDTLANLRLVHIYCHQAVHHGNQKTEEVVSTA